MKFAAPRTICETSERSPPCKRGTAGRRWWPAIAKRKLLHPHRRAGSTHLQGGELLVRRNPPESRTHLQPAPAEYRAARSSASEPFVRASRRFLGGLWRGARCIPVLPLPINGSSGCVNPLASPSHDCLQQIGCLPESGCLSPSPLRGTQFSVGPAAGRWRLDSTCPPRRCDRLIPSPLSCVHLRPVPPVARTRRLDCLAQVAASLRWPYLGHSRQSAAFQTPADSPAPDTTPAATLLARLFLSFTTAVTSVGRLARPR